MSDRTPMIDALFARWAANHEKRKAQGRRPIRKPRVVWELMGDDGKMRRATHAEKIQAKKDHRKIQAAQ